MKAEHWREKLGELVRGLYLSPEMKQFYCLKIILRERK